MAVNFEIIRKETCPICNGQKKVESPEWIAYNAEERSLFGRNPDEIPSEEEWCGECEGEGILTKTVDLMDALKELGIMKQLESLKSSVSYASNVAGCLANGIIPD